MVPRYPFLLVASVTFIVVASKKKKKKNFGKLILYFGTFTSDLYLGTTDVLDVWFLVALYFGTSIRVICIMCHLLQLFHSLES